MSAICRISGRMLAICAVRRTAPTSSTQGAKAMAIDENKLNEFMGKFVGDLGAVMHAATVVVGDALGLYKALAEKPATADELAKRTGTDLRYLREWLSAQTA